MKKTLVLVNCLLFYVGLNNMDASFKSGDYNFGAFNLVMEEGMKKTLNPSRKSKFNPRCRKHLPQNQCELNTRQVVTNTQQKVAMARRHVNVYNTNSVEDVLAAIENETPQKDKTNTRSISKIQMEEPEYNIPNKFNASADHITLMGEDNDEYKHEMSIENNDIIPHEQFSLTEATMDLEDNNENDTEIITPPLKDNNIQVNNDDNSSQLTRQNKWQWPVLQTFDSDDNTESFEEFSDSNNSELEEIPTNDTLHDSIQQATTIIDNWLEYCIEQYAQTNIEYIKFALPFCLSQSHFKEHYKELVAATELFKEDSVKWLDDIRKCDPEYYDSRFKEIYKLELLWSDILCNIIRDEGLNFKKYYGTNEFTINLIVSSVILCCYFEPAYLSEYDPYRIGDVFLNVWRNNMNFCDNEINNTFINQIYPAFTRCWAGNVIHEDLIIQLCDILVLAYKEWMLRSLIYIFENYPNPIKNDLYIYMPESIIKTLKHGNQLRSFNKSVSSWTNITKSKIFNAINTIDDFCGCVLDNINKCLNGGLKKQKRIKIFQRLLNDVCKKSAQYQILYQNNTEGSNGNLQNKRKGK